MARGRHPHPWILAVVAAAFLAGQAGTAGAQQTLVADASGPGLRVAAVQLQVGEGDIESLEAFRRHMRRAAHGAAARGADLVVFPEYTGALAALVPYAWAIAGADTASEALARIAEREPWIDSVREVFLGTSGFAFRAMCEVFGEIAATYGVHVVAGTYFARVTDGSGRAALANRALVFGPDGELTYAQDKVFLTDFEDALGMVPGSLDAAHLLDVDGLRVALTICRDTFFDVWERRFPGADLWIDIKGNGEPFTPEVERSFARALPERLGASGVPAGLTVCLTGELLEFVWEGPSSVEALDGEGRAVSVARARAVRGEETLVAVWKGGTLESW